MRSMNKRAWGALTAALVAGSMVAGCAGTGSSASDASPSADGKTTEAEAVTLDFWSNHPGKSKAVEEEIIAKFEAENPGVKIKLTDAGASYEEVAQKYNAALSGGQVPDLIVVSDVTWFNFALNDQLLALDEPFKAAGISTDDYVDTLYSDYKLEGSHYALPYSRSTPLFYYNKDVWAKAGLPDRGPETWEEFEQWAPKIQSALGSGKAPLVTPPGSNYLDWYFQGMIWSFGGNYSKDWKMTMTEPAAIEAGEFLKKMYATGAFKVSKTPAEEFGAGQAAALLESTGSLGGLTKDTSVNLGTSYLPSPDGRKGCPTGGAGVGIPAKINPANKDAALKFLEFLTNADNTVTFTQATGYMPVRKSAMDNPEEKAYLEANPNAMTAVRQLAENTQSQDAARVFVPGGGEKLGAALDKISQGADVKATFEEVSAELQQIIDTQIKPKL
ncbi:MAG: ABC transporter substrate-binding protein [Actinomycetaceae bacterium]|nr:ABC transporter substrate-binding protein [Actinomycetaceae bacterium]